MIDQDIIIQEFSKFLTEQGSSAKTQKGYVFDLQDFLSWTKNTGIPITQTTEEQIKNYITYLQEKKKSIATINRSLSTLRIFFQFFKDHTPLQTNPMEHISNLSQQAELKPFQSMLTAYEAELKQEGTTQGQITHQKTVVADFLRWINQKSPP